MAARAFQRPESAISRMLQLRRSLSAIHSECKGRLSLRYVEWMVTSAEQCIWTAVLGGEDALAQLTLDLVCLHSVCNDATTGLGLLDTYLHRVRDALGQWNPPDTAHEPSNELLQPELLMPCPLDLAATKPTMFHRAKMYTVFLRCPVTSAAWVIRRRSSDFLALHQVFQVVLAQCSETHRHIAWVLRFVPSEPWPKQRWIHFFSNRDAQETLLDMERIGAQLLFVWWLCRRIHRTTPSTDALAKVQALLQSFLQVPASVLARVGSPLPEDCSICLTDMFVGAADTDTLVCGHSFHVECFSTWVTSKPKATPATCPLCRRRVIGRTSTA